MHDPEFSSYQAGRTGFGFSDVSGDAVQNIRNHAAYLQGQLDAPRRDGIAPGSPNAGPMGTVCGGADINWGKVLAGSVLLAAVWGGLFGASDNADHRQRNPFVSAEAAGRFAWRQALGIVEIFDGAPDQTEKIAIFIIASPYEASAALGAFVGNAGASVASVF